LHIGEASLSQNVFLLRGALGEASAEAGRFVETVRGVGYRFTAPVERGPSERRGGIEDSPSTRRWRRAAFLLFLGAGAVLATGLLARRPGTAPTARTTVPASVEVVTRLGTVGSAAISPDGRRIAYSVVGSRGSSIWLAEGAPRRHAEVAEVRQVGIQGLDFSRDGHRLYFVGLDEPESRDRGLYRFDLDTRSVERLRRRVEAPVTVSSDEDRLAFAEEDLGRGRSRLLVGDLAGERSTVLAERSLDEPYSAPSFTLDGTGVVASVGASDSYGPDVGLVEVSAAGGAERVLLPRSWRHLSMKAALPDGSWLLVGRRDSDANQIWHLRPGQGEPVALTAGTTFFRGIDASADGSSVVSVESQHVGALWIDLGDGGGPRAVGSARAEPRFLPGGGLLFVGADQQIWRAAEDGGGRVQLTHGGANLHPAPSPDGRWVVFASDRDGRFHLWRVPVAGGEAERLTNGPGENYPEVSPDGRFVFYTSVPEHSVWRLPWAGGAAERVSTLRAWRAVLSDDGRWIALALDEESERPLRVAIVPSQALDSATSEARFVELPAGAEPGRGMRFGPTGASLFVAMSDQGRSNIAEIPFAAASGLKPPTLPSESLYGFDRAIGKWAMVRGAWRGDVVLLRLEPKPAS
jgi:Tol biopolymer transport system component